MNEYIMPEYESENAMVQRLFHERLEVTVSMMRRGGSILDAGSGSGSGHGDGYG